MSITNGLYEITSALSPDIVLGRGGPEDRTMLPKSVVTLKRDGEDDTFRRWVAVEADDETFILKAANIPTAEIDGELKAVLMEEPTPTNWRIIPVPQHGKDAYVVTVAESGEKGWALDSGNDGPEPHQPVRVRPLIVGFSEPPFYPRNEVFVFKRIG